MIEIDKIQTACQMLGDLNVCLKTESVPLQEAYGRVLAADVIAKRAVPSFFRSAYDGYALRSADIKNASAKNPVTLQVTEVIPAGSVAKYPVSENTAARIMTGAMLPEGADAVIKHEDTEFTSMQVTCFAPVHTPNVVQPDEDVAVGTCLAKAGKVLEAAHIAAMAGQGMCEVYVYKKPTVAILSTGSELVSAGQQLELGKIYNTNPYLLGGYLQKYGMISVDCGIVEDDIQKLAKRLECAFETCDMVITTGGVSAGDFDYIPKALDAIGAKVLFHRLPFKPGGAMLAAHKDGKVMLGLSGNPGAAAVGMLRIGLPYMKKLCGLNDTGFTETTAALEEVYVSNGMGVRYLRGRAIIKDGRLVFVRNENQRNGSVSSMTDCNLLGEILPKSGNMPVGTEIKVYFV